MAHPLIYVPKAFLPEDRTRHALEAVGLPDHVANAEMRPVPDGPDGTGGNLYAWLGSGPDRRWHFNAAEQTWFPAVTKDGQPSGRYWVGMWNDSPPTEKDLRRPYRYGGKVVELAGEKWLVPTPEELPHTAKLADDGSWRFVVQRQFHDYTLRAMEWVERCATPEGEPVSMLDFLTVSIEALSLNYRLTPELVSHLGLFDQVSAAKTFTTALGLVLKD